MTTIPQKACRHCDASYPETPEFFYRNANCKNGLSPWCKNCMRAYHREWDTAHRPGRPGRSKALVSREERRARVEKRCAVCKIIKPLKEFVISPKKTDGHDHRCKACDRVRKRLRRRSELRETHEAAGYIYLVRSAGRYKIGLSISPQTRAASIQSPFPVELVCVIPADNMLLMEAQLHERFDHVRKHGEWFDLSDADVEQIKHMVE